ncbi:MAG: hypothetical protein ACREXW_11980 [Gammaproteobacteria bacterium]
MIRRDYQIDHSGGNAQNSRGDRTVFLSMLGISWFWFYGATWARARAILLADFGE